MHSLPLNKTPQLAPGRVGKIKVNTYGIRAADTEDKPASLVNAGEAPEGKGEEQEKKKGTVGQDGFGVD